jgi:hypothetical protein
VIARVRILVRHSATASVGSARASALRLLRSEFPTVPVDMPVDIHDCADLEKLGPSHVVLDAAEWNDLGRDFAPFDERVDRGVAGGPTTLVVLGMGAQPSDALRAAFQMLTRWQRLIDRRNESSRGPLFDAVLARFRSLHELYGLQRPLVRADYNHALDTWQWLLRLCPDAGAALQMAALLHDVERLESEADGRVEHLAPDYTRFKEAHARRGSLMARRLLEGEGAPGELGDRVAELVAGHERPEREDERDRSCDGARDRARAWLNDADGLSFFSQNSAGYMDYFGDRQTRCKIEWTLGRMRPAAVARIASVRLRADVRELVRAAGEVAPSVSRGAAS